MPKGIPKNGAKNKGWFGSHRLREKSGNWKGGKTIGSDGYIFIYSPNHPYCDTHGYVREHRLIVEKSIGRFLLPHEKIHHKNRDKKDNRLENLLLFKSNKEHLEYHKINGESFGYQKGHKKFGNGGFKKGQAKPKNAYVFPKGHPDYNKLKASKASNT